MTLHLTQASNLYTLQVGDRLVSGSIHDPLANKTLVYWARDGFFTLGYSGLAYLGGKPTDEWIAEKLWGNVIPKNSDDRRPVAVNNSRIVRWLDIGQSAQMLVTELETLFRKLPPGNNDYAFTLVVAGWQQPGLKRFRPHILQIVKKPGTKSNFRIIRPHRYWFYQKQNIAICQTPGGYLSQEDLSFLKNGLIKPVRKLNSRTPLEIANDAENVLVEGIRRVASRYPKSIGKHCMSVLLPPPVGAPLRIRFLPAVTHEAVVTTQTWKRKFPVGYTPWIIGPKGTHAPSVVIGRGWELGLGPYRVTFEGSEVEGGFAYMGSQRRYPINRLPFNQWSCLSPALITSLQ